MGFPEHVSNEVMVKCSRHCCLCGEYKGLFLQLHHIVPKAQGGDDSADNCIPLCPNCHAEVENYNPKHALVRKFSPTELKAHRDKCYAKYAINTEEKTAQPANADRMLFKAPYTSSKVRWGFLLQDQLCSLTPGMVVLIGGCSGAGKSLYVQNIAFSNLQERKKVLYLCMKDSPNFVLSNIVARASMLPSNKLNQGLLTAEDWTKISIGLSQIKEEDLVLLSHSEIGSSEELLLLTEKSGAEIVIIDDFEGLFLNDNATVSQFMYRLKQAAIKSNAVVFIVHNMDDTGRQDKRPMLRDFPSDCYYRLCDIVQFLFRPSMYDYWYDVDEHMLEIIVAKNRANKVGTIQMAILEEMACVFAYDSTPTHANREEVEKAFDEYLQQEKH